MAENTPQPVVSRREERRARRANLDRRGGWAGGLLLIGLGVLLVLQNLGSITFDRWWGLLILIPAAAAFMNAWQNYREFGSLSGSGVKSLIGGILLLIVTAAILFDLNWGWVGPILLMMAGIGLLLRGTGRPASG